MVAPWRVFDGLLKYRSLLWVMIKRDVIGRYKGSVFGLLWSLFNPILTLSVYTLVFGGIFSVPVGRGTGHSSYAVFLFSGIIFYLLFAECVNRSPTLIIQNANYVKRVVFPLEILPWVTLGSAVFHFLVSSVVLLAASLLLTHTIPWTFIFFPLPLACLIMLIMGCSWFLASLGVFLRDIAQSILVITSLMLYLSPVLYDIETFRNKKFFYLILQLNPLTFPIEQMRRIFIGGQFPNFWGCLLYFLGAMIFAWLGLLWFQKTRKGFADVI